MESARVACSARFPVHTRQAGRAGRRGREEPGRVAILRDVSREGVLHRVSRERAGSACDPGAAARSPLARDARSRGEGARVACRGRIPDYPRSQALEAAVGPAMRVLPHRHKLRGLSPGAATAGAIAGRRGTRPRRRGHRDPRRPATHATDFTDGHAQLASAYPQTCAGCHVQEQCLQPPARCRFTRDLSSSRFHDPAPGRSLWSRGVLFRLPQPGPVLPDLPPAERHRFRGPVHRRTGDLSRRESHVRGGAWAGGASGSRELCQLSRGEGLHGVSFSVRRAQVHPHGPNFPADKLRKANPQMCTACYAYGIPSTQP